MYDTETAIGEMWRIADKPERMRCFHKIVKEIGIRDNTIFWHNFWLIWETSENLHEDTEYSSELIQHGLALGSPHCVMEDEERAAFTSLSDSFTVYRGCADLNQDGWSWTLDREKALWFANRAYGSDERFLLSATAQKADVLTYLMGRDESEIVIDPDKLTDHEIEERFVARGTTSAMFYETQSGKLNFPEAGRMQAQMMVRSAREPFDDTITYLENALEFATWADLMRRNYFEIALEEFANRQANPHLYISDETVFNL